MSSQNQKVNDFLTEVKRDDDVLAAADALKKYRVEADNRSKGVEKLELECAKKEKEIEALERQAQDALSGFTDPLPFVNESLALKREIESIRKIIPQTNAATDRTKFKQEQELKSCLGSTLKSFFRLSSFRTTTENQINQKLQELQGLFDNLDEAWTTMFKLFNIHSGLVSKVDAELPDKPLLYQVKASLDKVSIRPE